MLPLPNNPLIVAAVQALCCAGPAARVHDGGWRTSRDGSPYYEFWSGSGGRIGVRIASEDPQRAWETVEAMSALTLDTAVALLSALCSKPFLGLTRAPRRESVRLGAPAVLAAKQYSRYGAERIRFASAIAEEMERLLLLRFDIFNYPGFSPTARAWSRAGVSRADVCLLERVADGAVDPLECSMGQALRFGAWAEFWLNAGGPMWVAPIPQAILALDHRDNRGADILAKKTALLLTLNWAVARRGSKTIETDVRTFLRRIGELQRPSVETSRHSGRFADRFEEALFRLADSELMDIVLLGESAAAMRAQGRRWFDTWLDSGLVIHRPAFLDTSEAPQQTA